MVPICLAFAFFNHIPASLLRTYVKTNNSRVSICVPRNRQTSTRRSTTGAVVGTCQDNQVVSCIHPSGNRLTQVGEVRQILEEVGKALLEGIQGDGTQGVRLAFLVA
jgi:hypothetical protein